MPYIHFTEEQKRQANAVDLVEFLRFKGEPLVRSGRELRMERNHSVTVRDNEWYDHAAEKGGGPVSFLKEFYGMSYQQAVLTLLDQDIGQLCPQADTPREKVKKEFTLPPANENNRRAFAYLLKHRHLDRDVLTAFVRLGLIYEDKGYHNAVFVGKDDKCEPHHAHKRSTNSQGKSFRMTVEGSDFRYAFNWPGASGHLLVFEAPVDMLSFISMYHDSDWAKHSYVALCGTSSQPLLGMLERYPDIKNANQGLKSRNLAAALSHHTKSQVGTAMLLFFCLIQSVYHETVSHPGFAALPTDGYSLALHQSFRAKRRRFLLIASLSDRTFALFNP